MRVALLLRGVDVGGVTVRSAALLAEAGLDDVATVLASGNAMVTATDASSATRNLRTVRKVLAAAHPVVE